MAYALTFLHDILQRFVRSLDKERAAIGNFVLQKAGHVSFKVLDFGCGEGASTPRITEGGFSGSCVSVDRNWDSLMFAKRSKRIGACLMGDENLCFKDKIFDFVILSNVFHHLREPVYHKLVSEIHRVMAENSYLIVVELLPRDKQKGLFLRFVTFFEERIKKIVYWKKDAFEFLTKDVFEECHHEPVGNNFEIRAFRKISPLPSR
jgi:ubiquinone/menaquinone biosynthesis C-methylase UbiE